MKVVGLITEYNPFHNGHKYHLEKSKEIVGATHSVAVMSGNFLQRGEPALFDKWERAKAAVKQGVDLVLELPVIFSCNSAEFFALGSTSLLNSLNIVDYLCFGSEDGELKNINLISDLLADEPSKFKKLLKEYLDKGYTFPAARQKAIKDYLGYNVDYIDILNFPNNILGIEYVKSLKLLKSKIKPLTIKRIKADYNSLEIRDNICSATAIRNMLQKDYEDISIIKSVVPNESYKIIREAIKNNKGPIFIKDLEKIILYKLRISSIEHLKIIHDINEGLENRLKNGAILSTNYDELISYVKTKRYTMTRLQRIFIKAILDISKKDVKVLVKELGPQYIRVLGFNNKGADLLKKIKKVSCLPIITNLKRYKPENDYAKRMIEIDIASTDIYSLLYGNKEFAKGGLDFIKTPYIHN
ncbi:nucleotidyltransferase [Paramaledivibacter caminithermalis]|jgi:predicted nucleotidyltransferase|uniref:tRNA(Met) cytidine acetate ligase n=1 Tax=Paramaledivibacter caminithermalis (strain DSM 15212 / CIP 107654 / DViRD3) TaxID=1121301 RepID=A0A1M6NIN3_PARC5|nr:nucleotidyltransferase [Paramaledivibacter caminithermalis]SHJ95540.1 Predicted nucleotidyltransferase [Paramaledivibacter caminithermalis DSM 15212]